MRDVKMWNETANVENAAQVPMELRKQNNVTIAPNRSAESTAVLLVLLVNQRISGDLCPRRRTQSQIPSCSVDWRYSSWSQSGSGYRGKRGNVRSQRCRFNSWRHAASRV